MSLEGIPRGSCGSKVLVDFSYIGTGFHGLAYQAGEPNTVEYQLFNAFARANMVSNVLNNGYERCGRTDKDVHALHNYCSFFLDTCSPKDQCIGATNGGNGSRQCYRIKTFVKAVNKHLPKGIRINSVTCVPDDFSARRNCIGRTYKYFFELGTMDLSVMQDTCQKFVGLHNFLHFCKIDPRNRKDTNTTIYSFEIERYNDILCVATIVGRAFLWHQVRCMVGMLFLVGNGTISGETIQQLLEQPQGPKYNYKMASPHGLVLVDCSYEIQLEDRRPSSRVVYQEELEHSIQRLGPLSLLANGG